MRRPAIPRTVRGPKKGRGWKRRIRALERWTDARAALDVEQLLSTEYVSAELWVEHWPRPIPPRVRRAMLEQLFRVHDAWLPAVQSLPEPAYLGIWIFGPDPGESQVVAAVGERGAAYRALHAGSPSAAPPPALAGGAADPDRFAWTGERWTERARLADVAGADRPGLLRSARRVDRENGDVVVTLDHHIWRARLRDSA